MRTIVPSKRSKVAADLERDKLGKRSNKPIERRATNQRKVLQEDTEIPPKLPRKAGKSADYPVGIGVDADVGSGRSHLKVTSSQLSPNRNKSLSKIRTFMTTPYTKNKRGPKKLGDTELNNN
jgi:hypothetical protein